MQRATNVSEEAVVSFLRDHLSTVQAHRKDVVRNIKVGASLFDAGLLDSLSFLDVIQLLERTYAIAVPPEKFSPKELGSLAQLSAYVVESVAAKK